MADGEGTTTALAALREEWTAGGRSTGRAHARTLVATERLLETTPLHDLTVADILREAEISRPTFYSYFASKFEVVSVLYERGTAEMYGAMRAMYERDEGEGPEGAVRRAVDQLVDIWAAHRSMFRAALDHRHTSPEIMETTLRLVKFWVPTLADQIGRDREANIAPPGPPLEPLVMSLLWSTERTLYVSGLGLTPDLPDERAAAEPVAAMWLGTIYGIVPAPRPRRRRAAASSRRAKP